MPAPGLSKQRRNRNDLLGFFGFDAVTQPKMQDISVIPIEISCLGDSHEWH